jgi:hypothetical protein
MNEGKWKWAVMYMCIRCVDFAFFYDLDKWATVCRHYDYLLYSFYRVLICLYRFHCSESKHHTIIVIAYEVRILIILLYLQNKQSRINVGKSANMTYLSSIFSKSFHLFNWHIFHVFHIFALFYLFFFHIFPIFSLFNLRDRTNEQQCVDIMTICFIRFTEF